MASFYPNDLVSDADLIAYERTILSQFSQSDWQSKRAKTLEDWLYPLLVQQGLEPQRLRTRYTPSEVYGYTSAAFTDYTSAATSQSADDLPLATILATATDYLYVGSPEPFRGLSLRMLDSVNAVASTLSVRLWRDAWRAPEGSVSDGTAATAGTPFGRGGAITWTLPEDWVTRAVNGSGHRYWLRLSSSAALTAATAGGQLSTIRRSALCAPATLRTLYHIFHEAQTSQDGPWREKADTYRQLAEEAWLRCLPLIGREFDTDPVDDVIDADEATRTTDEVSGGGWRWERA
jgi:hypothetical protein